MIVKNLDGIEVEIFMIKVIFHDSFDTSEVVRNIAEFNLSDEKFESVNHINHNLFFFIQEDSSELARDKVIGYVQNLDFETLYEETFTPPAELGLNRQLNRFTLNFDNNGNPEIEQTR